MSALVILQKLTIEAQVIRDEAMSGTKDTASIDGETRVVAVKTRFFSLS